MKPKTSLFQRNATAVSLITAITFGMVGHSLAAEYNWNAATGDFETGSNWLVGAGPGTGVPGTLDFANVSNGGTAQYTTNAPKTVAEVRAGNAAAGTIQISSANTFTSTGNVHIGRQTGAGTGTLNVSGANTVFTLAAGSGSTLVGASSADVGTAGSGSTGILNITSGAVYNHTPTGDNTFRVGDNTLAQTGTYKGTLNVDGGTLNLLGGRLYVAQTAGSVGEVNVTNNGTINVNSNWIVIGRGGQGKLTLSSGTITKAGANNVAFGDNAGTGVADHTGGTLAVNSGELYIGNGVNGNGTYNLGGTGNLTVANFIGIGRQGGVGALNMTGGSITKSGANNFVTGAAGATGSANQNAGSISVTGGEFIVGNALNSVGTYNLSGSGSISVDNWIAVGRDSGRGTLVMTGGTITKTGSGSFTIGTLGTNSNGTVNASGGLIDITTGNLLVGEGGTTSTGTLNLSGTATVRVAQTLVGVEGTSTGNLNLNGGTLETGLIDGGTATSNVVFNGTLIKARGNATPFISDLTTSVIEAGGMKIDSNGFNLSTSFGVSLSGTGGVTKEGLGTLSLLGSNSYSGPTVVNAGKLVTTTFSTGTGPITVADGAGLGVNVQVSGDGIFPSALTLGASSLDIDLGPNGNDFTTAPIDVTGILTINGGAATIPINLTGTGLTSGQFPVIHYGNASALTTPQFASFKVGTLPLGVTAILVNNTAAKTVDLRITVKSPVWTGVASSAWNTSAVNWMDATSFQPVAFADGDPVLFSDLTPENNPVTNPNVTLANGVTVRPGAVIRFNNSQLNYILTATGTGKISNPAGGTVALTKQESGSLTINAPNNDFTGIVRIEGGSLSVASLANGGVASNIGASTAAPANLVLAGGVLSYTGASATTNRGFTVGGVNGGIEVTNPATNLSISGTIAATAGGLVKTGPGTLTLSGAGANTLGAGNPVRVEGGSLVLDGTGTTPAQVNNAGEIWVGSSTTAGASMNVTSGTLNVGGWLAVGRGNGDGGNISSLNISASTVTVANLSTGYANGLPNLSTQNVNIANSTFTNTGVSAIAENGGSTTNITLTGSTLLNLNAVNMALAGASTANMTLSGNTVVNSRELQTAMGGNASSSTITIEGTSQLNVGSDTILSYASIGFNGGTGNLVVKDSGSFLNYDDFTLGEATNSGGTGTITLQDNGIITIRTGLLGRGANNTGLINQTGGTFSNRGDNNMQIGVFGNATWNLSGGIVNANGYTAVGRYGSSVSSLNISGGTYNQIAADRAILVGEEGTGTLAVSGTGALVANGALNVGWAGSGVGTINQTGGSITVGKNVVLGENGKATLNLSGGIFRMNTTDSLNFVVGNLGNGQATLNISGTADVRLMNNASLRVGNDSTTANNTVTQTGGTLTTYSDNGTTVGGTGAVILGRLTATGVNTYNLNGGTLTVSGVRSENTTSTSVFNFKGGTLKAAADSATFMQGLTVVSVEAAGANVDTNSHNVTIASALQDAGGAGGLTKTGAGTLTLAGQNTYLGNTVISAGGVALADNARLRFFIGANGVTNRITGTGTATLDGDFNLELGGANLTNGNTWTLVDSSVNETYGASFSLIGFAESGNVWTRVDGGNTWTFSEATGVLTLTTGGVVNPYQAWTGTFFPGVTDPNIIGPDADPDGDGTPNSLEFALGGIPNNGADGPKVYNLQADGSLDSDTDKELLLTIAVRGATPAFAGSPSPTAAKDGYTYTIQGSLDLLGFTTGVSVVNTVVPASNPTPPSGYEYRTFSLNGSNNLTGKGFLRVKVN